MGLIGFNKYTIKNGKASVYLTRKNSKPLIMTCDAETIKRAHAMFDAGDIGRLCYQAGNGQVVFRWREKNQCGVKPYPSGMMPMSTFSELVVGSEFKPIIRLSGKGELDYSEDNLTHAGKHKNKFVPYKHYTKVFTKDGQEVLMDHHMWDEIKSMQERGDTSYVWVRQYKDELIVTAGTKRVVGLFVDIKRTEVYVAKNGNPLDIRLKNIKVIPRQYITKPRSGTYKGVSKERTKNGHIQYRAGIILYENGSFGAKDNIFLGYFDNEKEAAIEYDRYCHQKFGKDFLTNKRLGLL